MGSMVYCQDIGLRQRLVLSQASWAANEFPHLRSQLLQDRRLFLSSLRESLLVFLGLEIGPQRVVAWGALEIC